MLGFSGFNLIDPFNPRLLPPAVCDSFLGGAPSGINRIAGFINIDEQRRMVGGNGFSFSRFAIDFRPNNTPDGQIGIAAADISGKGIAAALLMSVVQASLRVISAEGDVPLSQLAEKMNGFLYRSSGSNKYATFFYAQLEDRGRRLRYVNAGHNLPYLVRGSAIVELSAGGTVIGLFPEMQYEEAVLDLHSGDVLVAFTDGVTEALDSAGEEFGEERLKDLLRTCAGASAEAVSSRVSNEPHSTTSTTSSVHGLGYRFDL